MTNTDTITRADPNDWAWWQNALKGIRGDIHPDDPKTGYYRARRRGQEIDSAIAYWIDRKTGEQRCHMDGAEFDLQRALAIWPYASKNPVTAEAYGERLRSSKWPNDSAAVVGHNAAPVSDDLAAINDRIEDLGREAEKIIAAGGATDAASADQASDLANTFAELEKKADRLREEEKAPHLEAGRAVDGKWRTCINKAADLKARLKRYVVTPFLQKQEEQRRTVQAAAVAQGVAPEAVPEVRTTAGSSKRSTGLRNVTSAEITDYTALATHLLNHPEVKAAVEHIANASAKAGVDLPGMKIVKTKVAA